MDHVLAEDLSFQGEPLKGAAAVFQDHGFDRIERDVFVDPAREVSPFQDWVKSHGIKIDHFVGMTGVLRSFGELLQYRVAERSRVRICINGEDIQRSFLLERDFLSTSFRKPPLHAARAGWQGGP